MSFICSKPWFACAVGVVFASGPLVAADLEQYRDFRLGSPVAAVVSMATTLGLPELKVLMIRPALLQELEWRPPYSSARTVSGADPVRRMVFSFLDDQLFRIVVEYDRSRTEGLTRTDMLAALDATYGPHGPPSPVRRTGFEALDEGTPVAQWRNADTTVALHHYVFGGGYGLVISSTRLVQLAHKARTTAVVMDAREAPAREVAAVKRLADEAREAAAKTRSTNKEAFRP